MMCQMVLGSLPNLAAMSFVLHFSSFRVKILALIVGDVYVPGMCAHVQIGMVEKFVVVL